MQSQCRYKMVIFSPKITKIVQQLKCFCFALLKHTYYHMLINNYSFLKIFNGFLILQYQVIEHHFLAFLLQAITKNQSTFNNKIMART